MHIYRVANPTSAINSSWNCVVQHERGDVKWNLRLVQLSLIMNERCRFVLSVPVGAVASCVDFALVHKPVNWGPFLRAEIREPSAFCIITELLLRNAGWATGSHCIHIYWGKCACEHSKRTFTVLIHVLSLIMNDSSVHVIENTNTPLYIFIQM